MIGVYGYVVDFIGRSTALLQRSGIMCPVNIT